MALPRAASIREIVPSWLTPGSSLILTNIFLAYGGFYLLIPITAVYFTRDLGFTAAAVGLVLAIRQITQQGLMVFGGMLADCIGYRMAIGVGALVRAVGFVGFGFARDLSLLTLFAIIAALGGMLFEAASDAALALIVPRRDHAAAFALQVTVGNIAMAVGPLAGVALLGLSYLAVTLAAASAFTVLGLLTLFFLPNLRPTPRSASERAEHGGTLRIILADRTFVIYTLLLTGFWFLFIQVNLSIPLEAERLGGNWGVGIAVFLNAAVTIIFQYPVSRGIGKTTPPSLLFAGGIVLMGAGLGLFTFTAALPSIGVVLVGVTVFAAGRLLVQPTMGAITARLARPEVLAASYGFAMLALGIGGSVGNVGGGWLVDTAKATGLAWLPWLVAVAVSLITGAGFVLLGRRDTRLRQPLGTSSHD